jgi:uncharacterized membrane protein YgcG
MATSIRPTNKAIAIDVPANGIVHASTLRMHNGRTRRAALPRTDAPSSGAFIEGGTLKEAVMAQNQDRDRQDNNDDKDTNRGRSDQGGSRGTGSGTGSGNKGRSGGGGRSTNR